jgi:hypothetical protein
MLLIVTFASLASLVTRVFSDSYESSSFRAHKCLMPYGKVEFIGDICNIYITCISCNRGFSMFLRGAAVDALSAATAVILRMDGHIHAGHGFAGD